MSDGMECCERYADAVFVYGSNRAGRNGAGAAKHAQTHHGAKYGIGEGMQPGGRSYAIPTKNHLLRPLSLLAIRYHVRLFLEVAAGLSPRTFLVTAIGTGLAGYAHADIAPMFKAAPPNCILPEEWIPYTRPNRKG